ncbi:MAG TPA: S9 family peptidase [Nitriliruptorales bacterium]
MDLTGRYGEIAGWYESVHAPAFGELSGASDLAPSPDGTRIVFAGPVWHSLEEPPTTALGVVDVGSRDLRQLTTQGSAKAPAWAPDGLHLAFLSDRDEPGVEQVWLLGEELGEAIRAPAVDGCVERVSWSPDGSRLLLVVADRGAELAGIEGSGRTRQRPRELPSWTPVVEGPGTTDRWRWAAVVCPGAGTVDRITPVGTNVWEGCWVGDDRIAAVTSPAPDEGAWYDAQLVLIEMATGEQRLLYACDRQVALPAASPDGRRIAIVSAVASDRDVVAGDLLLGPPGGPLEVVDIGDVDATHLAWRDDEHLLVAGHRGSETVVAELQVPGGDLVEHWVSLETCGGRVYPRAWPIRDGGAAVVVESATRPPSIATARRGELDVLHGFSHAGTRAVAAVVGDSREVAWTAPDGQTIHGWLTLPAAGAPPYPLVLEVHGGPVWAARNLWPLGTRVVAVALRRGFAVFRPNPRGSAGWGQDFAAAVVGDVGGADVGDILSGLDLLVAEGLVDPERVGVTGCSYGGYLTYVLTTRTQRFSAAVALSPVCDYVSAHHSCNIPEFVERFVGDGPAVVGGRYHERSPLYDAGRVTTPTLHVVGRRDRCAPATQGEFMHRALQQAGNVASVYVEYPEEGHGINGWPATLDYLARMFAWFEEHVELTDTSSPR